MSCSPNCKVYSLYKNLTKIYLVAVVEHSIMLATVQTLSAEDHHVIRLKVAKHLLNWPYGEIFASEFKDRNELSVFKLSDSRLSVYQIRCWRIQEFVSKPDLQMHLNCWWFWYNTLCLPQEMMKSEVAKDVC